MIKTYFFSFRSYFETLNRLESYKYVKVIDPILKWDTSVDEEVISSMNLKSQTIP